MHCPSQASQPIDHLSIPDLAPWQYTYSYLVATVVDLYVCAVDVDVLVGVVEDGGGPGVARVTRHVIGQHQDDVTAKTH